jgi:copper(I)-binding protein
MSHPRRLSPFLLFFALVGAVAALGACSGGSADEQAGPGGPGGSGIVVEDATIDWPANPEVAAVRMRIRNLDATEDALVGASSPIASSAMVHRTDIDAEGRAVMQTSEQVPIAARSTVTFEPSGLHVMLSGITEELAVGDEVQLDLIFREAGTITATATVVEPTVLGEEPA